MILILGRGGGAPVGVFEAGLADFGFGVKFECELSETFGLDAEACGEDGGPPGRGFLIGWSPVGSGFLAGFAVIVSLTLTGRPSLGAAEGRDVLPLVLCFLASRRITPRSPGVLVLRVTMRLFLRTLPRSGPDGFSVLGRLGAGV